MKFVTLSFTSGLNLDSEISRRLGEQFNMKQHSSDESYIYLTHKTSQEFPTTDSKLEHAKQMYGTENVVVDESVKTFIDMLKKHSNPNAHLNLVFPSTTAEVFYEIATSYNYQEYEYAKISCTLI